MLLLLLLLLLLLQEQLWLLELQLLGVSDQSCRGSRTTVGRAASIRACA